MSPWRFLPIRTFSSERASVLHHSSSERNGVQQKVRRAGVHNGGRGAGLSPNRSQSIPVRAKHQEPAMEQEHRSREDASAAESAEIRELREKAARADEYLDLARRTKADFINYQDRVRREKAEWAQEGLEDFILDFLPALDSFTWARFEEPALME